jgi:Na+/H+-dicarboxylate symporter
MKLKKFSLSTNILIGMILGLACGLFFGEKCENLGIIGDAFIRLLQMTIMPYIMVSLIYGIGNLSYSDAKKLAIKGGLLMFIFWFLVILVIFLIPISFPTWESATFYSPSMIETRPEVNYLDLYIPSNPFSSLANNIVPAVVFFSISVGVALIGIKEKKLLLDNLSIISEALTKVTHVIVNLTPIGVFAITASAAGTMTMEELAKLQVYFISYFIATVVLTFVILPLLVSSLTPFKYQDVMFLFKDALFTAFTTGNLFIILPIISENCKTLLKKYQMENSETNNLVDVIIPVSFNFPNMGKILCMLFPVFAGWYAGNMVPVSKYPELAVSGLLSFFGSADVAIPFLLDYLHLPADLFQLYLASGVINGRLATLIAAMHIIAFTLICTCSFTAMFKIYYRKMIIGTIVSVAALVICIGGAKIILSKTVHESYTLDEFLWSMKLDEPVETKIHREYPSPSILKSFFAESKSDILNKIKKRKVIRVGYSPESLPFSFFNKDGELVGFDIAMANKLANDLGCKLEMIPISHGNLKKELDSNVLDIVMSGITVSPKLLEDMTFTEPYMRTTPALIVKNSNKNKFANVKKLKNIKDLRIAMLKGSNYRDIIRKYLPDAAIVPMDSTTEFFEKKLDADLFITSAEQAAAWTIIYPNYSLIIAKPLMSSKLVAYPIASGDLKFLEFLNYWLEMQKQNGFIDEQYQYWILGKDKNPKEPRWSIYGNLLGGNEEKSPEN